MIKFLSSLLGEVRLEPSEKPVINVMMVVKLKISHVPPANVYSP